MCGIVGIIHHQQDIVPDLLKALELLEYRGYDSSGIATITEGKINRKRAAGNLANLKQVLAQASLKGNIGISHTRWATHGRPTLENAHPHVHKNVALVHNGIIENHQELRQMLEPLGYQMQSDTDSEVIACLISHYLDQGLDLPSIMQKTLSQLQGSFALAILIATMPDQIIIAKRGSPLVIGLSNQAMCVGSDAMVLAPFSEEIIYLEDDDWGFIQKDQFQLYNAQNQAVSRSIKKNECASDIISKGEYPHFMLKEIHEQPQTITQTLHHFINPNTQKLELPKLPISVESINRITLIACGTSYYACLTAKYWLENLTHIAVDVDIASEFRYRSPPFSSNNLSIFVSQSGETADTLAALRLAKQNGQTTLAIVNVPESSIAREATLCLPTSAGAEIGVASTKAFTAQLVAFLCLAIDIACQKGTLDEAQAHDLLSEIKALPAIITGLLTQSKDSIHQLAQAIFEAKSTLYLARGLCFPIALEGALKLKELSYIHAEGYAAGEIKHGPIALVDAEMPIIALAPSNVIFDKMLSNMEEIHARQGRLFILTDKIAQAKIEKIATLSMVLPSVHALLTPILYTVPLQMLAYEVALLRDLNVDQPRNLAKSVTVE